MKTVRERLAASARPNCWKVCLRPHAHSVFHRDESAGAANGGQAYGTGAAEYAAQAIEGGTKNRSQPPAQI